MPKDPVYCKRGNDSQKQVRTNNEKPNVAVTKPKFLSDNFFAHRLDE
jgi:hypothetical protein